MPPLLANFIHARGCKPKCEKSLTLPIFRLNQQEYPGDSCKNDSSAPVIFSDGAVAVGIQQ